VIQDQLKNIVEAALMAADKPLGIERLMALFDSAEQLLPPGRGKVGMGVESTGGPGQSLPPSYPSPCQGEGTQILRQRIQNALEELKADYAGRGIELKEVASGYRFQAKAEYAHWLNRLWEERPPRYSRALIETLAIIAYRQPITRAEIEELRGVGVSTGIVRTLLEREWIRLAGHRDVPGRPAVYTTTPQFLDYFNLKNLSDLPPLTEAQNIENLPLDLLMDAGAPPSEDVELPQEAMG
jgi:segregation and condensation protein B